MACETFASTSSDRSNSNRRAAILTACPGKEPILLKINPLNAEFSFSWDSCLFKRSAIFAGSMMVFASLAVFEAANFAGYALVARKSRRAQRRATPTRHFAPDLSRHRAVQSTHEGAGIPNRGSGNNSRTMPAPRHGSNPARDNP